MDALQKRFPQAITVILIIVISLVIVYSSAYLLMLKDLYSFGGSPLPRYRIAEPICRALFYPAVMVDYWLFPNRWPAIDGSFKFFGSP